MNEIRIIVRYYTYGTLIVRWIQNLRSRIFFYLIYGNFIIIHFFSISTSLLKFYLTIIIIVRYYTYGTLIVRWIQNLQSRIFFYLIYGNLIIIYFFSISISSLKFYLANYSRFIVSCNDMSWLLSYSFGATPSKTTPCLALIGQKNKLK